MTPSSSIVCKGDSVLLTASGASTYNWSPLPGLSNYTSPIVWAYPATNTQYTVTGSSSDGCTGSAVATIEIIDGIELIASKNRDAECNNNVVELWASGADQYSWSPTSGLSSPNDANTNALVTKTTTYYVVGTKGTCKAVDSVTVNFYNENNFFIPNAFSPNDDGLNDCFSIKHQTIFKEFYLTIYNRWGQRVFETDHSDFCWNGYFKDARAESGTYFYFLKSKTSCGEINLKGDLLLIR